MSKIREQIAALVGEEPTARQEGGELPPVPSLPVEFERPRRRGHRRPPTDDEIEQARLWCSAGVTLRTVRQCLDVSRYLWEAWKERAKVARKELEADRVPEFGDEKCLAFVEATTRARGHAAAQAMMSVYITKPEWWLERSADALGLPDADERGLAKVDRLELTGADGGPMEMAGQVDVRAAVAAMLAPTLASASVEELRALAEAEDDCDAPPPPALPGTVPGTETEKPGT